MNNIDNELEYLMNPALYSKYTTNKENESCIEFIEDKCKYKEVIMKLTEQLFEENIGGTELNCIFNTYIRTCIWHLNQERITKIYQDDYKSIKIMEPEIDDISLCDINRKLISINKENTMDKYIIKSTKNKFFIPKKKNICN